jgi:hypothetical protein
MKTHLMRLAITIFAIVAIVSTATAQQKKLDRKAFIQNVSFKMFDSDLQSNSIPGFVESTLYTLVQCKDRYPDLDYSQLLNTVDKVARESNDPATAYKAYLVRMYFAHSSEIQVDPFQYENQHDQLFKQIADQLTEKLLAFNSK